MTALVLQPTDTAQWHALVTDAQHACRQHLDEPLESYLVCMLMRFTKRADLLARAMALELLDAQAGDSAQQPDMLRDVGDKCLLLSGFFPRLAERRLVRVSYFVRLGRSAYHQLAALVDRRSDHLYAQLGEAFVVVMDVLQAMRGLSGQPVMGALAAAELWADTGSCGAYQALVETTSCTPAAESSRREH
jgi:hypothetical protein